MRYYKKITPDGERLVKAIDEQNNYAVMSDRDPEPTGYINHQWTNPAAWTEITASEASEIVGYDIAI